MFHCSRQTSARNVVLAVGNTLVVYTEEPSERRPTVRRPRSNLLRIIIMHGVRRGARPSAEVMAEQEQIAREQASLVRRALKVRQAGDYADDALKVVGNALMASPDEYSLWAHRREALLHLIAMERNRVEEENSRDDHDAPDSTCRAESRVSQRWKEELGLSLAALKRHPKAYPAWQHRIWLLSAVDVVNAMPEADVTSALRQELQMSSFLLSRDGRNFHGWAHRMRMRKIAPHLAARLNDELDFVTCKINQDFANYSAWHHRSVLLPLVNANKSNFISAEIEFVRQAFYTEPDVQSAWFYHRWLLAGAPRRSERAQVDPGLIAKELAACTELLDLEPDARMALLTQADLFAITGRNADALEVYEQLADIDPMRRGYYEYKRSKILCSESNTLS